MKEALQRIQKTLDQLEALKQSTVELPTTNRPISFQISPVAPKVDLPVSPVPKGDRLTQLPQLFPFTKDEPSVTETKSETQVEPSPSAKIFALELVVQRIQALYYEGPIVNAWIDSELTVPESSHEVEEIVFERPDLAKTEVSEAADSSLSLKGYRVCGIDESGQQWSYPCPVDQLLELSVAIARYRQIQELLAQKRQLEVQLEASAIAAENDKF